MPTLAELIAERERRRAAAAAASGGTAPEASPSGGVSMEALIAERDRRRASQAAPVQPDATPWGDGQAFDDMYAMKPEDAAIKRTNAPNPITQAVRSSQTQVNRDFYEQRRPRTAAEVAAEKAARSEAFSKSIGEMGFAPSGVMPMESFDDQGVSMGALDKALPYRFAASAANAAGPGTANAILEMGDAAFGPGLPFDYMGNQLDFGPKPKPRVTFGGNGTPTPPKPPQMLPTIPLTPASDPVEMATDFGGTLFGAVAGPGKAIPKEAALGGVASRIGAKGTPVAKAQGYGVRTAGNVIENVGYAGIIGANMAPDGQRAETAAQFMADPLTWAVGPGASLIYRGSIALKTAGGRVTPEYVRLQQAMQVLQSGRATPPQMQAAAQAVDELTPPLDAGTAQPGSAVPDPRIGAPPRGSDLPPDQRPSGSRPIPGAWAVADDGAMLPNAQAPTPPYPRPDPTQPAAQAGAQQPPVSPMATQTAQQAPTQPQTATAPPVPPIPPNAPAVTAGAPQPIQPATAVSSLGEAEVWYNALPQKTRESILRTMTSSGVRDRADQFAIIADLNSLPPGRNSQNAFLISQKWGERYPSLRENLLNMGGEFSATNPRANDQKVLGVFGKGREDRAQAIMDTEGRKQVVSERGFLERSAETNFGKPSAEVAQQLKDELSGLGKRYTTLLDPTRKRQFKDPTKIAGLQEAESNLKTYLKQPWIIDNMPEAVRNRLMVDASKEIRDLGWSAEDLRTMAGPSRDILAPLFEASGPLPWSPKMWEAIAEQYPRFAAHVLQSSYAKTARDLSKSINAADNVGTIGQLSRMRGMGDDGNVIPGGLLDKLQKTMPNSDFSPTGAGSYADARVNYGDVKGAQEALKELENFKAAAQRGENVADIIEKMDSFSPRQKEAALSQITAFVQDSMGAKVRNIAPGQVGMAAETAPNLTQLGNDNFLAALRKVFGQQGDALANDIELARSNTTFNTDMNRRIGPNTQLKQENVRNAPRAYEDPAGLEGNVVDSTVKLAGAAGLGAAATGQTGAAAMLAATAALQAAWNGYKRGKRLNNTERSLLADFFFRSREAGVDGEALLARAGDAPPRSPNLPSPIGYAGNVAVGAGAGGLAGSMSSDGDPNSILAGIAAGAVGGGARAGQRAAKARSSIIKPRPINGPANTPNAPRPLPGQTSNASPAVTGALVGGAAGYAAAPEDQKGLGLVAGIAGGSFLANRLAKGAKPKAPPAKPAFDQRFMKEAQRLVSYNGGVDKALKAQQYVIDQLKNSKAPNAQDRINRAVSIRSAIERMAERSNRELDEIAATAPRSGPPGVKPPPVKNGFGGFRDLPMDEGSGSLIEADAISRIASGKSVPTSAELDDALKGLREAEFDDLVRQFGGDRQKAEKFRSLWRQAENAPTRQEADMLDAQRQKLIEGMPDVEPREFVDEYALRQLRDAFRDIENGNAVKALNDSMTDLPTLREVQDGKISSRAQAALAILRKATQEARLQGLDPKQMMNSALESYGRRFSDPVDAEFMVGEVKKLFAAFDPSQEQSSKLLAGMGGNSRGIADNLKQDAALAAFGSAGGSFANQDDPQAGALAGMGLALGGKYVPRAVNAMRGAGRVKPPPVRGADQAGIRTGPPTATKPAAGNKHGLEPSFREVAKLKGATAIDKQMRPPVTKAFTPGNADKQLSNIDRLLANHPAPEASSNAWSRMMADMVGDVDAPIPPHQFLKDMKNGGEGAVERLKKLTPEQIAEADHGFHQAEEFRQAYVDGDMRPTDTTKLFMWSFLSRGVSPYVQESMFLDAFKGADEWIEHAVNGTFDGNVLNGYKKWASEVSPAGSGLPGSGTQHNLNAFGEHFLRKMAQRADDGETYLKKLHDMIADPNLSGPDIRRAFSKFPEGIGIDNKVVSFTLLASGRKDVMVLDRIQVRALFNDGRFGNRNIYDPLKEDGAAVAGTALADITYGAHGVVLYEAIERALAKQVDAIYAAVGRPQDASIGRYHWDTWNAASGQEASHGTLGAILKGAKKSDNPLAGIRAKEGEYGGYAYNSEYGISADGERTFHYTTPKGSTYEFSVPAYREFIAEVKKAKNGVVPSNFKVTQSGNAPWTSRPEVNTDALDALAARYADRSTGERAGRRSGSQSAGGSALPGNGPSKVASGPKRLAPTTSVPQVRRPKPPPQTMGFSTRPKPPQTGNALAGKPPKGPPGTLSRMVAGGAVGGIAGGVAGEAGGQEEDLTAEMNSTKKDIDDLNAALKTWDSLDVMGKQRLLIQLGRVQSTYVDKNGARRKFDDGTTGDRTEPLFKAYAQEKRDALEKAEAGLEALKKQSAYRQFQKEQNPFFDAVRELGPSGAMALAGAAATVLRIRGVGKSKAAVKVIEKDINDLLTNGPVKSLLKKGGAANTERNRAVNMNEFYRQGGAPDSKLPFNYGAAGYKPNPKAAKPGSLYSSKTTTKMDGVGSQFLRPNDIKVLGVGLLDSVAIMPFVSGAEEELKKAKEDVDNGNDSIEALRRVEKAKTDLAMYQTIQRIGWGLAGGGALGAAYRYKLPKPDIRGAEEEVAAIGGYLRSIAPPKTPRAPKALAPPATPQTLPVAGPPAQLLLPAPSPPLKKPKPKPKPKPKKP